VVPPEGFEVKVIDCPLSITGEEGVIAPAPRAEFTVTVSAAEQALAAGVPWLLSVAS
jgi:NAD(P)H-hydrate repair Nnr-like enzyme with NAD(P)H-hydrate epimerase domain